MEPNFNDINKRGLLYLFCSMILRFSHHFAAFPTSLSILYVEIPILIAQKLLGGGDGGGACKLYVSLNVADIYDVNSFSFIHGAALAGSGSLVLWWESSGS